MHVCLLTYSQQAPQATADLRTGRPTSVKSDPPTSNTYIHNHSQQLQQQMTFTLAVALTGCVSEKTTKLLLHPFNGLFSRTTWVSWYQKSKTSLDLNEARDNGVLGCSGISWTTCKQYAPRSRQITTPTPRHSISTG